MPIAVENQWCKCRVVSTYPCPSVRASSYPSPSLPSWATIDLRREHHHVGSVPNAVRRFDQEPTVLSIDRDHAPASLDCHAKPLRLADERF